MEGDRRKANGRSRKAAYADLGRRGIGPSRLELGGMRDQEGKNEPSQVAWTPKLTDFELVRVPAAQGDFEQQLQKRVNPSMTCFSSLDEPRPTGVVAVRVRFRHDGIPRITSLSAPWLGGQGVVRRCLKKMIRRGLRRLSVDDMALVKFSFAVEWIRDE